MKEKYIENQEIRIYLAGPMTGIEDYNFPLFNKITREIRAEGYQVFNPAEFDNADQTHRYYMIRTLMVLSIFDFDMIVLLPNWEKSKGVKIEKFLADNMVDLPVILVEDFYNQNMPIGYSEK